MSGANGQPWDFIVVTDAAIKKEPFRAYAEVNQDFIYWMEEQRDFKLRHPAYQMTHRDTVQRQRTQVGCGRRLPPSSSSRAAGGGNGRPYRAPTRSGGQSHRTDRLANASMLMHLAADALGLGSQHVSIHIEEPFKRILGLPDLLLLVLIRPIGLPTWYTRSAST
jgi:nitroreductase